MYKNLADNVASLRLEVKNLSSVVYSKKSLGHAPVSKREINDSSVSKNLLRTYSKDTVFILKCQGKRII